MTEPNATLRRAFAQHQAGALHAACDLYGQVLASRPAHPDALHLLGAARATLGDKAGGIALIRRAIAAHAELHDFADTAALIEALDLVISVDTAVARAAGAPGRPVWVLNRFDRCWRWMMDRTDSPWYPTMHLLTQTTPGVWEDVVADAADALASG
jgi:hypothetical protein